MKSITKDQYLELKEKKLADDLIFVSTNQFLNIITSRAVENGDRNLLLNFSMEIIGDRNKNGLKIINFLLGNGFTKDEIESAHKTRLYQYDESLTTDENRIKRIATITNSIANLQQAPKREKHLSLIEVMIDKKYAIRSSTDLDESSYPNLHRIISNCDREESSIKALPQFDTTNPAELMALQKYLVNLQRADGPMAVEQFLESTPPSFLKNIWYLYLTCDSPTWISEYVIAVIENANLPLQLKLTYILIAKSMTDSNIGIPLDILENSLEQLKAFKIDG